MDKGSSSITNYQEFIYSWFNKQIETGKIEFVESKG